LLDSQLAALDEIGLTLDIRENLDQLALAAAARIG
jgi:hypothetical protein